MVIAKAIFPGKLLWAFLIVPGIISESNKANS